MKPIKTMLPVALVALSLYACGGPIENDSPVVNDTTAPNFIIGDSDPPEGDVAGICTVTAGFDDPLLASTITAQSFIIKRDTSDNPLSSWDGTWGLSPSSDAIALFVPLDATATLVNGTYTVTLTTDITNAAGINLATEQGWTFTITDAESVECPPLL
jgi:hypothetical protein